MPKHKNRTNLYVATVFNSRGTEAIAGWVRKNGDPSKLPSGSKRIKNISGKMSERVASILGANAALRDIEKGSRLLLHSTDAQLCELINSGNAVKFVREALRERSKPLVEATQSLVVGLARHSSVHAECVHDPIKHAQSFSMLQKAHEEAKGVKKNVAGHKDKKRKNGNRSAQKRAAIEASLDPDT